MAKALVFVKKYNDDKKSNIGELVLFGNTFGEAFPDSGAIRLAGPCKWYQLGCWWNLIFGDYSDEVLGIIIDIIIP